MKLKEIKRGVRLRMHQPIPAQGKWLKQVVTGYFNYRAVPTNGRAIAAFHCHVMVLWRRTLRGRTQKDWTTWARIKRLAADWLPQHRIRHPWPNARFAVRHPRREPYARNRVRTALCGGRSAMSVPTATYVSRPAPCG